MADALATEVRPLPDPLLGRTLGGRYRITSLLGRGGMSRVYQAVQAPLQRAVALKVLKDDPADPAVQRRFLFEASTTAQLTHPNTITIFDYGADQGLLYFAMELLRGCTLSQLLRRDGRLSEARAVRIARQVCRSLREAHGRGLVHRDLKPSNLFLVEHPDEVDVVKVLDFGLVKVFGAEDLSSQLTGGGMVVGTPHYMAPEQARGLPCDERSDIYSLGVVLFQMLTGKVPFDGTSGVDVLVRQATEPAPRMRALCSALQVSPELEAVVARCMAKKPDQRFRSMEELMAALPGDGVSGKRPPPPPIDCDAGEIGPAPLSGKSHTPALSANGDTRELSPAREAPRRGRRRATAGGAALLAMAVATGVAVRARPSARAPVAASAPALAAPAPSPALPVVAPATPAERPSAEPAQTAPVPAVPAAAATLSPRLEETALPPSEPRKKRPERAIASPSRRSSLAMVASAEVVQALRERLARVVPGIRQCAMLDSRRAPTGELELTVTIDGSGRITAVALAGPDLGGKLESCMRAAVQRVRFEPFDARPVTLKRQVPLPAR